MLQALNQDKARAYFPSHDEASMWDMIDVSALPSNQSDLHSGISHLAIQNRFWEHHPSSSVHQWDDFSRVCPAAHTVLHCLLLLAWFRFLTMVSHAGVSVHKYFTSHMYGVLRVLLITDSGGFMFSVCMLLH